MEWQMYFSAENLPEVGPVVMNYKMKHIIRIGQRGIVLYGQTIFSIINYCGSRKTKKHGLDMRDYM